MFQLPAAADENRRAVDEAHALGTDCLVMVVGGLPEGSRDLIDTRARVQDGLAALLPYATAAGVSAIKSMFSVDECRVAASALGTGNNMLAKCGLTRCLRTINFGDTASRHTTYTQGKVKGN